MCTQAQLSCKMDFNRLILSKFLYQRVTGFKVKCYRFPKELADSEVHASIHIHYYDACWTLRLKGKLAD